MGMVLAPSEDGSDPEQNHALEQRIQQVYGVENSDCAGARVAEFYAVCDTAAVNSCVGIGIKDLHSRR